MPGYCCKPKKGLNNDSSMSLMLNVVAARTKPKAGWPAAGNGGKCCPQERNGTACSCNGNANPLNNTNIYRNTQIFEVIRNCRC